MKTLLIAAALGFSLSALAAPVLAQDAGKVTFRFATARAEGTVMVQLFDSAAAYDGGGPIASQTAAAGPGGATVGFEGLPAGDYAMRAFHDVDGDGEMGFNPFGMPTEPYAFSNNAVGNMGPASWERASFRVEGAVVQAIELR